MKSRIGRRIVTVIGCVILSVPLVGCLGDLAELLPTPRPAPSGQAGQLSSASAEALIEQVPGISQVSIGINLSGFSYYTVIELEVEDRAVIDSPEIIEFLFEAGWATTAQKPGTIELDVGLDGNRVDLQDQVNGVFGVNQKGNISVYSAFLDGVVLTERWGPWPGAIPAVPLVTTATATAGTLAVNEFEVLLDAFAGNSWIPTRP